MHFKPCTQWKHSIFTQIANFGQLYKLNGQYALTPIKKIMDLSDFGSGYTADFIKKVL